MKTIVFDVYGTLINLASINTELEGSVNNPAVFFETWRNKQLEYSFRRGLMNDYKGFSEITKDALYFTNDSLKTELTEQKMAALLTVMANSPAYPDANQALMNLLKKSQYKLYAFSNGEKHKVASTLENAVLLDKLVDVISVESVASFKPNPVVYQHFCHSVGVLAQDCLLVSSNPFDVIGAKLFGMQAVWIKRHSDAVFDYWEVKPDYELPNLLGLEALLDSLFVPH